MVDLSGRFFNAVVNGILSKSCNSSSIKAELKSS